MLTLFSKGLHSACSVVGHTDEGGLTRDVLRECRFGVPFGGLPSCCPAYEGLPSFVETSALCGLVQVVDSLLLRSATAVAHAAPVIEFDSGTSRPVVVDGEYNAAQLADDIAAKCSTLTADDEKEAARLELEREYGSRHVRTLKTGLSDTYGEFAKIYCGALEKILCFGPTNSEYKEASEWISASLDSVLLTADNRHLLKNECVAPFFWIEPSSLLPRCWLGTRAEEHEWASLGLEGEQYSCPFFVGLEETDCWAVNCRA